MSPAPVVALVGATGAAGSTLCRVLDERRFPMREFRPLASARSAGSAITLAGTQHRVGAVQPEMLTGCDLVFFAAGSSVARQFAPLVAGSGGVAIDKSSAYRMDPAVPLVVPEVNADTLRTHRGIVANPNCVAIPLTVALAPLHRAFGLRGVTVATYQAASGGGRDLVHELDQQARADVDGDTPRASVYPHVLHGNVVPGGWTFEGPDTEEELKVAAETRRVLGLHDLRVSVTTVRVPVETGHSAAVWAEFEHPASVDRASEVLRSFPGIQVVDDPSTQQYPTPRAAAGQDDVMVGRIRVDAGHANALAFFFSADNLRKGAATNAVQVAELVLLERERRTGQSEVLEVRL